MTKIKDIVVGYEHSGRGESVKGLIAEETLIITCSDGSEIHIELFERRPGQIIIRGDGCLIIHPQAGNTIAVSVDQS